MSDIFDNLSRPLQRLIDEAFDLAAANVEDSGEYPTRQSALVGGGFIVDPFDHHENPNYIALSLIPQALSCLNLPPDDEQAFAVFRNAASGWSSATTSADEQGHSGSLVSRDDWRSVCAVLLESRDEGLEYDEQLNDTDEYQTSRDAEDSEDEYEPSSSVRRPKRGHIPKSTPSPLQGSAELAKKQRETCFETFSLFFPEASSLDVSSQRISLDHIRQAAVILGEKLTSAEIMEMLEMFSSSPDKSMNLMDFSRMMVAAKLV